MENLNLRRFLAIYLIGFISMSLVFLFAPIQLDIITKVVILIFNGVGTGVSIPTIIAMRMQIVQTNKLKFDMNEMKQELNIEKNSNLVGLVKLQKFIYGDLRKITIYYKEDPSGINRLFRVIRNWQDKYNAVHKPSIIVAEKLLDDYNELLTLLETLEPHIQRIVLSYVFDVCDEYMKAILGKNGYRGIGSKDGDEETVKMLTETLTRKWIALSTGFMNHLEDVQNELYTKFEFSNNNKK